MVKLVLDKAWQLDDTFRDSTSIVFENNDLLLETIGKSHYMTWWWLADKWPEHQKVCETMAQLVCHASRLKSDDIRYKGASMSTRSCHMCELGIVESVVHLVMQCPAFENRRKSKLEAIYQLDNNNNNNNNNNNWNLYSAFSIHKMFKSAAHCHSLSHSQQTPQWASLKRIMQ